MEKCEYCGIVYHPMTVYVMNSASPRRGHVIHVCSDVIKKAINQPETECYLKAESDGYIKRVDLTPKR